MELELRLRKGHPIGQELERILTGYLELFDNYLTQVNQSTSTNIHEIRRLLKRMRAYIRFIRVSFTDQDFRKLNEIVGIINRTLAEVREARVNLIMFERIKPKLQNKLIYNSLSGLQKHLEKRCKKMEDDKEGLNEITHRVRTHLLEFTAFVKSLIKNDFSETELIQGIEDVYRTGKKLYKKAINTEEVEIIHTWRKYVKHIQFQLQFISGYLPEYYHEKIEILQSVSNYLGEEHDLYVFHIYLKQNYFSRLTSIERYQIEEIITKRRNKQKNKAFELAQQIFDTGTKHFRKEIESFLSF